MRSSSLSIKRLKQASLAVAVSFPVVSAVSGAVVDISGFPDTFGAADSFNVTSGASYSVVSSTVTSFSGALGSNASPSFTDMSYAQHMETPMTAQILYGYASANTTVEMAWRSRVKSETSGLSTSPPMSTSVPYDGLASDIVNLSGIASQPLGSGESARPGSSKTDIFVLQMSYSRPELENKIYECYSTTNWTELDMVRAGANGGLGGICLDYLNLGADGLVGGTGLNADHWENAVSGNYGVGASAVFYWKHLDGSGVEGQGDWDNFVREYNITQSNIGDYLGSYGVDITNHVAWAILDHNSQFAVVPEPSAAMLLTLVGLPMLVRRNRRGEKSER